MITDQDTTTREKVRERYARAARGVDRSCCDTESCGTDALEEGLAATLYSDEDIIEVPSGAADVSLGCGNPTAVAELREGETVLDLGSGGGIDVLLSAKRVGPTGFVYGLDMTDEMLDLARKHQREAGATNVEFLKGYMEDLPLGDSTVDVVISNCVINLSADKPKVLAEIYRILRDGGRIGISDILAENHLTEAERLERGTWVGCIAGALSFEEYEQGLSKVGFTNIEVVPTHEVADRMHSAIIRATK
jgi:SAM-dependent methyltransferase